MIRILLFSLALVIGAAPVYAESYKWIDDSGTVNFTEDYSRIPKKYRKKARIIGDVSPDYAPDSSAGDGEAKKGGNDGATPGGGVANSAAKQEKKTVFYGGKSGDEWSSDFRKINAEIKSVRERIEDRKSRLANPDKMTRAQYLGAEYEIRDLEQKLEELESRSGELDRAASMAGVPYDLRR